MAISEAFNRMDENLLGHTVVSRLGGGLSHLQDAILDFQVITLFHPKRTTPIFRCASESLHGVPCVLVPLLGSLINRIASTGDTQNYPNAPSQATPESTPVS
jgi:hypothetical protein